MAQYRSLVLPAKRALRAYVLATLHRDSAVVWQTAAAEIVESRDVGPDGTAGLSATPADPASLGWTRLTPAP
jgi:hypothetical protein